MTLRVDRIENQAGSSGVDTDYVVQGSTKMWANINPVGSTSRDSFNLSSWTDNGTGDQTFNLTNAMANADYAITTGHQSQTYIFGYNAPSCWVYEYTAITIPTRTSYTADSGGAGAYDASTVALLAVGDLA